MYFIYNIYFMKSIKNIANLIKRDIITKIRKESGENQEFD